MNRSLGLMLGSVAVAAVLLVVLAGGGTGRRSAATGTAGGEPIVLFCAVSNRDVIEAIRTDYERETGRSVDVQYGPSQTLLSSIEVSGSGDLYLPADESFLRMAEEKELIAETIPLARMQAVVAVRRDSKLDLSRLDDLLKPELRLVQGNSEATAIGMLTRELLSESGRWDELDAATDAYRGTVSEVAADVLVGAADVGIVYDAVLHTYPDLKAVEIEELSVIQSPVTVGVVAASKQPAAALHFARYLSARDRGLVHYAEHGFQVGLGDKWNEDPELSLFAGSMLRPAIERAIVEFEEREGVRVNRVYNGCGILVAQIRGGQRPDAYFACDTEFMGQVVDLFPESVPVAQNRLVILVPKGNPKDIQNLEDLTRPGLRLGIGHQQQSAMGWLTQNTFRDSGFRDELMANVQMETPSGDMLVNQMQTGSLDAAIAYASHARGATEFCDAIPIEGIASSIATQPWAVAKESEFPLLAGRLFAKINNAATRQTFEAEGFRLWDTAPTGADE